MTSKTVTAITPIGTTKAVNFVDLCCTKIVNSGKTAYVTVSDEPPEDVRTSKDNSQFHAIIGDIHKQGKGTIQNIFGEAVEVIFSEHGDFEDSKTKLLAWFVRAMIEMEENVPKYMRPRTTVDPCTGQIFYTRASTTKYSAKQAANLCQFLWSTGIEFGVVFSEPSHKEYEKYREAQ